MTQAMQYDSRKRPTASELRKHPFFTNYTISKEVYNFANSHKLKKNDKYKGGEMESLKISPSGITIEKDNVDGSPFNLNKHRSPSNLAAGFELRKPERSIPLLVNKPSYNQSDGREENGRKSMLDYPLNRQSVLLQNSEDIKPSYYKTEERSPDYQEYKPRIKEPIYPYYQNNNDVLSNIKMPNLILEERSPPFKPRVIEVDKNPFRAIETKYSLAEPAMIITAKSKKQDKSRKYQLDFTQKNRSDQGETYRPSDSYAKRVLNVQQSLPDLGRRSIRNSELDR